MMYMSQKRVHVSHFISCDLNIECSLKAHSIEHFGSQKVVLLQKIMEVGTEALLE